MSRKFFRPKYRVLGKPRQEGPRAAFTLIEVLVAMAVLILLVTLLTSTVSQTAGFIQPAESRMETYDAAGSALDRLASDFQMMVTGGGATLVVGVNNVGGADNNFLAFLSRIRGPKPTTGNDSPRLLALLYSIQNYTDRVLNSQSLPMLGRSYAAVPWDVGTLSFLENAVATAANSVNGNSALTNKAALADGILRMAVIVQNEDGEFVPVDQAALYPDFTSTPPLAANCHALDLTKVKAVIVSLAVLDPKTRSRSSADLAQIAGALPVPKKGETPLDTWQAAVNNGALEQFGRSVGQNIRLYQRIIPLP